MANAGCLSSQDPYAECFMLIAERRPPVFHKSSLLCHFMSFCSARCAPPWCNAKYTVFRFFSHYITQQRTIQEILRICVPESRKKPQDSGDFESFPTVLRRQSRAAITAFLHHQTSDKQFSKNLNAIFKIASSSSSRDFACASIRKEFIISKNCSNFTLSLNMGW